MSWILELAIRATLLLVPAFVGAHLLRKRSAAARHMIWVSAVVSLLLLPLFVSTMPRLEVPVLPLVERSSQRGCRSR